MSLARKHLRLAAKRGRVMCQAVGCKAFATVRPVLLLVPARDYVGPPARVPISLAVCAEHVEDTADAYLDGFPGLWESVLATCPEGLPASALPVRELTRLAFDELEPKGVLGRLNARFVRAPRKRQ